MSPARGAERRALMARSLAFMFAAGALALVPVVPGAAPSRGRRARNAVAVAVTFALTALDRSLRRDRIPHAAYPWLIAAGTVLITAAIHFRGEPTAAHALFYLWIVFYSFYFFAASPRSRQLALALAGYGRGARCRRRTDRRGARAVAARGRRAVVVGRP